MPTALIYGHSQSGGMGLDVQKLLSKAGWKVVRVTKVGWSDGQLGAGIPELTGSPGQYDRIFYYGGANPKASKEATGNSILANVAKLGGPSKVTVVLAPYNDAKGRHPRRPDDARLALRAAAEGRWRQSLSPAAAVQGVLAR